MALAEAPDRRFVKRPLWIICKQRYETEREVYERLVWYTQQREQNRYPDEELLEACEQALLLVNPDEVRPTGARRQQLSRRDVGYTRRCQSVMSARCHEQSQSYRLRIPDDFLDGDVNLVDCLKIPFQLTILPVRFLLEMLAQGCVYPAIEFMKKIYEEFSRRIEQKRRRRIRSRSTLCYANHVQYP